MSKNRHSEALIISALRQVGRRAGDVAREVGVSRQTIYAWRAKYMREYMREMEETKRLRDENTRVGKLVAGLKLEEELHSMI